MKFSSFTHSTKKAFKKMKNKKFFPLFLTIGVLLFAGVIYAQSINPDCHGDYHSGFNCYQAPGAVRGSTQITVAEWNDIVCLKNLNQKDLFIPTNTGAQWHSFSNIRNEPYLNVQSPLCVVGPPICTPVTPCIPPCYFYSFEGSAGSIFGNGGPSGGGGPENGSLNVARDRAYNQISTSDLSSSNQADAHEAVRLASLSAPPTPGQISGTYNGWDWTMYADYEAGNPPGAQYGFDINVWKDVCIGP